MKHAIFTTTPANDDEEWDRQDAADVYFPDMQQGETEVAFRLRLAFEPEGYVIGHVESAPTHPVLIVRAVRQNAAKITVQRSLCQYFQNVLRRVGFSLRRNELTVDQRGNRILLAFQWRESTMDYAAARRQADEDAAEFEGMPL